MQFPILHALRAELTWSRQRLPEDWTVEDLLEKHSSQPRNPDIATTFFLSGYVESWGAVWIR